MILETRDSGREQSMHYKRLQLCWHMHAVRGFSNEALLRVVLGGVVRGGGKVVDEKQVWEVA